MGRWGDGEFDEPGEGLASTFGHLAGAENMAVVVIGCATEPAGERVGRISATVGLWDSLVKPFVEGELTWVTRAWVGSR